MVKLLRKDEIAAMLGTSPGVAASILAKAGVHPIDFGAGRGRGCRWYECAVSQVLADLHKAAQPREKAQREATRKRPTSPAVSVASMSVSELYELTHNQCVQ